MTFHENEYDGIVLKIPTWWINLNNIQNDIEKFKNVLENCNISTFYSDHVRNLYELNSYKEKKEFVENAKKRDEDRKNKALKDYNDILEGNVKILDWENYEMFFAWDDKFYIDDEEINVTDVITNKNNVKTSFTKKLMNYVKDIESFKTLIKSNRHSFGNNFEYMIYNFDKIICSVDRHGCLRIKVPYIIFHDDVRRAKNGGYKYFQSKLGFDGEKYFKISNNNFQREDFEYEFERKFMKLIKK